MTFPGVSRSSLTESRDVAGLVLGVRPCVTLILTNCRFLLCG